MTVEVRQAVPLRTVPNVELAAIGTWKASTGETTFTDEDFANAVAALDCPGVRNPVIKLGHSEEDSTSGVRWDGEPAVGWVAGMRYDSDGKMRGDFTGMPAWLADPDENGLSVLAAAYPDRSIEIYRPFVCQIGHEHPAVITAVALLGVYAPGVGVLKSMQDVYAAWTEPMTGDQAATMARAMLSTTVTLAAAADPRDPTEIEIRSGVDFAKVRGQWDSALDDLVDNWADITEAQRDELAAQVADAVDNNPDTLGDISADAGVAALLLLSSMKGLATKAAAEQVAEAKRQGVDLTEPEVTDDDVRDVAEAVAAAMAASTAASASRTAAQALGTGDGTHVADLVTTHLDSLTDRFLRDQLGGALSAAQARGRSAALAGYSGPADFYASELNDVSACAPCKSIDGKRFDSLDQADAAYGGGKYVGCAGGARCRGQLITVFGDDRASATALVRTTIRMALGGPMTTRTGGAVKASVSVEDISRKYYESAGYSMWITAMHVDPLELIASDDANGKFFRIPVELSGEEFTFGDPQEVAVQYTDVKAAASSLPVRFGDRKAALLAAGKNEDGSDRIAKDVSPAGAAIRKAVHKVEAPATVIETEVPTTDPETPAAEPATGPITNPEEASVDAAKIREALGLGPDATDAEVAAVFASSIPAVEPAGVADPQALLSAIPAGADRPMIIDPENYKTLVSMAAKGEAAFAEVQKNKRDVVLGQAARDGRFPISRLAAYQQMWDKDPAATESYIQLMPKNSVPVMAAGILGAEINQNESDAAYEAMYGKAGA